MLSTPGAAALTPTRPNTTHGGMAPASGDSVRCLAPSFKGPAWTVGTLLFLALVKEVTGYAPHDLARLIGLI
ncbi:hypothetical protein [Streptomyces macrosporus]|uniref:Uncharacterized protein n=1 Tax=Streptomyces macrosporus TaxID=44032 RepID=A0ABN3KK73_9ACTN